MELIKLESPIKTWTEAKQLIAEILEKYSAIPVVIISNDTERASVDIELRDLATVKKQLDLIYKELKKPADQYKAQVDQLIKPVIDNMIRAKSQYETPVLDYNRQQREIADRIAKDEAKKKADQLISLALDAEMKGQECKANILSARAENVVAIVKPNKAINSGSGTTRTKKWELVDISLVPSEYTKTVLNEEAIRLLRANTDFDAVSPVEGIKFWCEESLRTRSW